MGMTEIKRIQNNTGVPVSVNQHENQKPGNHPDPVQPNTEGICAMWIPWCFGSDRWGERHYITVARAGDVTMPHHEPWFWIWQHGESVRCSTDGSWHSDSDYNIPGESGVNGRRRLVVETLPDGRPSIRLEIFDGP